MSADTIRRDAEAIADEAARPAFEALARLQDALKSIGPIVDAAEAIIKRREIATRLFVEATVICPRCGEAHAFFNVKEV